MRIAIDARWIFREASGIGVYTRELINALAGIDRNNKYTLLFDSGDLLKSVTESADLRHAPNFSCELLPCGLFSLSNQTLVPRILREHGIDVFHSPNYMIPLLAFPRNRKGAIACVITIHDVIPLLFPHHAPRSRKSRLFPVYRQLMLEIGRRANMIIADSDASRRDIITHLRIPPERQGMVKTVYCGVSGMSSKGAAARPVRRKDEPGTILYVGRSDPYKNCIGLIEAFALTRTGCHFPVNLLMAGSPDARYPEIEAKISALGLGDCVRRKYLSDAELSEAYRTADVLALPSLYEGFGLPVAEAMACGLPVVCSNRGSLPEVAGDAAIQVDPTDIPALAAAMTRVLSDPALAADLSAKGLRQANKFTWKQTATATLAAYLEAMK